MDKYIEKETKDRLIYLMGLKLNNFKNPQSYIEKEKIIMMGKEWFEKHPNESINIY